MTEAQFLQNYENIRFFYFRYSYSYSIIGDRKQMRAEYCSQNSE